MHQNCVCFGPKCSPVNQNAPQAPLAVPAGFLKSGLLYVQTQMRKELYYLRNSYFALLDLLELTAWMASLKSPCLNIMILAVRSRRLLALESLETVEPLVTVIVLQAKVHWRYRQGTVSWRHSAL